MHSVSEKGFSIRPGLDPQWLSCFEVLDYYSLLFCRVNTARDALEKYRKTK